MSQENFHILLSSAGRRVEVLRLFQRSLEASPYAGRVLATDMSRSAPAFHAADEGFQVPRCTDAAYIPTMMELCRAQDVRLLVPLIDTELATYAEHRDAFEAQGTRVMVSGPETIAITRDKTRFHHFLKQAGLPTVEQWEASELLAASPSWAEPRIAKLPGGSCSVGIRYLHSQEDLASATQADPSYIVQSLAPGIEYTISAFVDQEGQARALVPRRRIEVRAGEVSKGLTVRQAEVSALARRVLEALPDPRGVMNLQIFHCAETGSLNVIEVNARFGGGYPLAHEAGVDFPGWLIEETATGTCAATDDRWRDDVVMLRYDAAIFLSADEADV